MVDIYKEENDNNIIRYVEFDTKRIPLKSLKLIHVRNYVCDVCKEVDVNKLKP
jgi:hypothetical protein